MALPVLRAMNEAAFRRLVRKRLQKEKRAVSNFEMREAIRLHEAKRGEGPLARRTSLTISLTRGERYRLQSAADHLEVGFSVWARSVLLAEADEIERGAEG